MTHVRWRSVAGNEQSTHGPIRSVRTALHLITVMNARGSWSFSDLVSDTGLAQTIVHRFLQTLEAEAFVQHVAGRPGQYRHTSKATALARGVTAETHYTDLAEPLIVTASREIGWPLFFSLPEGTLTRLVCRAMSVLPERSARTTTAGETSWLFGSAAELAYLSRCSDDMIAVLRQTALEQGCPSVSCLPVPTLSTLERTLRDVRGRGLACRPATRDGVDAGVYRLVFADRQVIGVLGCSTFLRMLTDTFLANVTSALTRIAAITAVSYTTAVLPLAIAEPDRSRASA